MQTSPRDCIYTSFHMPCRLRNGVILLILSLWVLPSFSDLLSRSSPGRKPSVRGISGFTAPPAFTLHLPELIPYLQGQWPASAPSKPQLLYRGLAVSIGSLRVSLLKTLNYKTAGPIHGGYLDKYPLQKGPAYPIWPLTFFIGLDYNFIVHNLETFCYFCF